jgi:hypothetical protein
MGFETIPPASGGISENLMDANRPLECGYVGHLGYENSPVQVV